MIILMVAIMSVIVVSCGGDDKKDDPTSIYGSWRRDSKSGAGYVLLKLNPDGTAIQEEHYYDDDWSHPTSFSLMRKKNAIIYIFMKEKSLIHVVFNTLMKQRWF